MENKAILPDNSISRSNWRSDNIHLHDGASFEPLSADVLTVDIVIPVYNEEKVLAKSIVRLEKYLFDNFPYRYQVTVVDNGSTDATREIALGLYRRKPSIKLVSLDEKGRGRALKYAWGASDGDVLVYMDVDLSTDLSGLLPLIEPLVRGQAALAIGTRLRKSSETRRSLKRELISQAYNRLIKWSLKTKFSDAQCGFKAIRKDAAEYILPEIADDEWFFDTELLVKAERKGWRIHEVPVIWREDADSRVNIIKTAVDDIKGLARVRRETRTIDKKERLALAALLIASFALYLLGASHNAYANSYYTAAVQAATASWKAFFFGSLDAANFITVDKPPVALWFMALSTRIFGFSGFAMILPNAVAGTATIWLVYTSVQRFFGRTSALLAGFIMLLSPVAALMFSFNNPDGFLTLFLAASGYAFLRALDEEKPLRWLALAGVFTGFAFNTKMLQGLILLPVMTLVYLCCAKPSLALRIKHLLVASIPTAVSTLWWSAIVSLVPASNRPYVGSGTRNSIWDLILGYNGLGRLLGNMGRGTPGGAASSFPGSSSAGMGASGIPPVPPSGMGMSSMSSGMSAPGGMPNPGGMGGPGGGGMGPGGNGFGGQTGFWRMFNSDFGPNIAWFLPFALISAGLVLWLLRGVARDDKRRASILFWGGWILLHSVVFSVTSGVIHPYYVVVMAPAVAALVGIGIPYIWEAYTKHEKLFLMLPFAVFVSAVTAAAMLAFGNNWPWMGAGVLAAGFMGSMALLLYRVVELPILKKAGAGLAAAACLVGPIAFTLSTAMAAHTGSIPTSGPQATALGMTNNESAKAESSLVNYLLKHRAGARWIVAVASANESAPIQITSGQPVMAAGGFMGSDGALTVDKLKALVKAGELRYYAVSSRGPGGFGGRGANGTQAGFGPQGGGFYFKGPGGGPGGNTEILSWVKAHGKVVNYGESSVTLYELKD